MSPAVTTILFDLDETLCEYPKSGSERLSEAFQRAGVEPFFSYDEYRREVHEVGGTESDIRRRETCFKKLARRNDRPETIGLRVADAYEALTDYTAMQGVAGMERVLSELGTRYRLGLVTNGGPDTQSVKIDSLGVRDAFETIILAGWDTEPKPNPEPFVRALEDLDSTRSESVYVGNSIASDVLGANRSGLQSVWIPHESSLDSSPGDTDSAEQPASDLTTPDYRLDSLRGLLDPPWETREADRRF